MLLLGATPAAADTFTVSNGDDMGAGSLRQAIADANANANDPTVDEVDVNFVGDINLLSELPQIDTSMTITGSGVNVLNVRRSPSAGMSQFRLFSVVPAAGRTATIEAMTISGARALGFAGGAMIKDGAGTLILDSVWVNDSQTPTGSGGGAFCLAGMTSIRNSTLSGNLADFGGGFAASTSCTAELVNTTITGNSANSFGGGIYISGNSQITVGSSTIAGNKAEADNSGSGSGGGSYNASGATPPNFRVANTIYAANTVGTGGGTTQTQCGGGDHTSSGYNLRTVADSMCTGFAESTDLVNANPMLGVLDLNLTGPPTIALLPGSPAIDAANPATNGAFPACPAEDERGVTRGSGNGTCDIGAFELQHPTTTATACAPTSLTLGAGRTTCTATVTDTAASQTTPTLSVDFTTDGAGAFSNSGSCTLTEVAPGQGSCSVTYTPSAVGTGSHQITGAYGGDVGHDPSQGSAQVGILTAPVSTPPGTTPPQAFNLAAGIKKCKKKFPKGPKRKKCIKRAKKRAQI